MLNIIETINGHGNKKYDDYACVRCYSKHYNAFKGVFLVHGIYFR